MTGLSDTPAGDVLTDRGTEDTKVGRTYQFDASTKPQKAALQELGGLWGGGATLLSPGNGKRPFRLKGQQDLLGDMSVVQFEATPLVATRPGPGRDYHAGTLSVTVTLKGSVQLVVGGNSVRLRPGDAAIYHPKYLYHLNILEPSQQIRATIPYGVAGDSILDRIVVEKVAGHTPQAQLLTSQLKTLCEALSKRQRANALHLSRGLGGFLTGILEPEPALETRMDPHFFKRLAILNFVEDNLTSGTLTPSFLADRFAVSRATLYRIFQDLGGIANHVVLRRLDACYAALLKTGGAPGAVCEIADRFGFYDAAHFAHRFKHYFGQSPKRIADLGRWTNYADAAARLPDPTHRLPDPQNWAA